MTEGRADRGRIRIRGFESERDETRGDSADGTGSARDTSLERHSNARSEHASRWRRGLSRFARNREALVGLLIVCSMSLASILARPIELWGVPVQPVSLAPYPPSDMLWLTQDVSAYDPPSAAHPMGLDGNGRDVFSRVLVGGRYSISIGLVVVTITSAIGIAYGSVAGYYGDWVDEALMRVVDMILAFPGLVLALVVVALFGNGYWQLVLAFSLFGWASYARVIRGEVLEVKETEYVVAAKALGASDRSVLFRHIVPNAVPPVVVLATLNIGTVVIGVASLGFLGLGLPPATAEWGTMLEGARDAIVQGPGGGIHWWVTVFPGGAIFAFVLSINLIGDAITDALDARETDSRARFERR
ncbi:ABC transporter permease [Halostagnicola kamekurae]|uniref:Peptide/nickel transport system permease protein n=1 Tax=Halostagnicola kamekurae TaxID=619731 RepID=A0A1I6RYZ7_9EURY|nr:ABC transporter permease [Halostagnicola kamekurae]SFS69929.1 peptide/nickel transport system permease protein [Halostagnicola kamekurae]